MGRAHEVRKAAMEKTSMMKSKLYSKFGKEIYMAAKTGGTDPDGNLVLKRTIERAKQNQVPGDVIKRNIDKAKGGAGEDYTPARYEGFGPGGATVIVECLTDNVNRTFGEVRSCFTKTGGKLGVSGSVTYLYTYSSLISVEGISEEEALEAILEAGIDIADIAEEDGIVMITGAPADLDAIKDALDASKKELNYLEDTVTYIPLESITLTPEDLGKFQRFLNMTNDLDDVQEIYHNVNIPEEE
ncbi:MAG TPA: YebC/PmpR family DNA-binding transcriptional regulator [Bacillota bacterium]|nr:YebC/PmpR family DNA-binding transcriptional regulator [Bacillota bacterium]HPF42121.1 YebC/PmpR family DNA-binding transcriptional regulator [Bacillota bacterium]HPJ85352.1 YebC/PmpR family DNA-binding transcriptional regulator [Bacillota bacterium]HPQ61352.1 YebC/PmpR family DNA-binding transcriptional regulator [Bacillota bacterium]HRX91414.1 YebC/PmpR family DNA-binding transcriptional regulator [Candidatus Izemoplasmatales bacterium]